MGKIKLNKDGLKGMFVNHVEKMVLGAVLLVFGVFVYTSLGLEGLPSNETPDVLIQSAKTAEEKILNPANATALLSTITVASDYVERVKEGLEPTKPELYVAVKPVTPYLGPSGSKRQDPALLPPIKPEVYSLTGGVAVFMTNLEDDLLLKEKNSTATPKVIEKKRTKKNDPMAGYGGMGSGDPGDSSGLGLPGMGGPGGAGMMGMLGAEGGMDPTGGAGITANPIDRVGFMPQQGSVSKSASCVVVKFVVPWKKQWEEYQDKFRLSLGHNPARDTPNYLSFTAERLEVSDDPQAPLDWTKAKRIWTAKLVDELKTSGWVGFAPEIADPRYLYNFSLTFPVPPFINRPLEPLALHTDVPKATANMMMAPGVDATGKDAKKKKGTKKKDSEESDAPVTMPGNVPGGGMEGGMMGPGMGGMMGPGMGGMPGGGMPGMMPGGSMPGMMPGGMMPGMGGGEPGSAMGLGASGMGGGMGMMPGMGGGMGMMPGMDGGESGGAFGMMGAMGDPTAVPGPPVPYLLIRFYDFTAEPGKKYRYRVQTILEDPNHPTYAQMEPSDRVLDEEVKKRLLEVASVEKTKGQRQHFRRTDFSEPSEPISIDLTARSLAGTIVPLKFGPAPEINLNIKERMITDEPEAKVMSVIWDSKFATEVTGVSQVYRGTFLNFVANGDAIHPVMLVFKSLPNYDFQTNRFVADIRGGEELAGGEKDSPLLTPGQVALVGDDGQIIIRSEFDDWDEYRKLALPEIAPNPAMDPGAMMGEGGMGEGPGMMFPGMGGKKGKAGRNKGGGQMP